MTKEEKVDALLAHPEWDGTRNKSYLMDCSAAEIDDTYEQIEQIECEQATTDY